MTRTRTTRFAVIAAVAGLALAACGGVDREGTRDNIVEQLADAGVEIDADCVDAALDKYSDDELESIDKTLSDGGGRGAAAGAVLLGARRRLSGGLPTPFAS